MDERAADGLDEGATDELDEGAVYGVADESDEGGEGGRGWNTRWMKRRSNNVRKYVLSTKRAATKTINASNLHHSSNAK